MTEAEDLNSVIQQVAPEVKAEVNEVKTDEHEVNSKHLKAMRLKNAELEKKLKERDEMFEKILQTQLASQATQKQEIDEFDKIGDEEYIPKGKVKELAKKEAQKLAEKIAKEEVAKAFQQQHQSQFMDRLHRQYSDFSEVVNPETLSLLEEKEPELAQMMSDLKDPYKIGVQSYKYIKAMGLAEKAPEARRAKEIDKAIEKSEKSIASPAVFDKRPIAHAFQLTDAMKKELYREMHGFASLASSVPEMG